MKIDINSDMGEGFGRWRVADDDALLGLISSANVACGAHAGDPVLMTRIAEQALARGVDVGAHPGLPDLAGFGRREMAITPAELRAHVLYQFGAMRGIAAGAGHKVTHFSFHAMMGNMVDRDPELAASIMQALKAADPDVIIYSQAGTVINKAAKAAGLRTLELFLADRALDDHGALVPRSKPNSVINDPEAVAARVSRFLHDGSVETYGGGSVTVSARSILVHSDTPGSVDLARTIRQTVLSGGGTVVPASRLLA